ncbi:MAG: hypothetical protein WCV73_01755 [Patescibacteria group bacterium]|jgi:hypothetical protein
MQKRTTLIIATLVIAGIIGVYYYTKDTYSLSLINQPTPININSDSEIDPPTSKKIGVSDPSDSPKTESKNTDQKWQEEICKNLSQNECENNDNCSGAYGSSYCAPNGGPCTMDMAFKSCFPSGLNANEIQQLKMECDKIGGEYNKIGSSIYCSCNNQNDNVCLKELMSELINN